MCQLLLAISLLYEATTAVSLKTSQECVGEPAIGPSKDCAEVVIRAVGSLCAGVVLQLSSSLLGLCWRGGTGIEKVSRQC